jgi:Lon protease-like protein
VQVPIFPLNTVLFPGMVVPLHVFEDRYRALVRDLLEVERAEDRVFGVVAIREGYEVGEHGAQSLHRVGTLMQLGRVERHPDGRFDIEVTGRSTLRMDRLDPSGDYLTAEVEVLDEPTVGPRDPGGTPAVAALAAFAGYRAALAELRGEDPFPERFPSDPTYLSYALAACAVLPLRERQELLEAGSAADRLHLLAALLHGELRAIRALPSLPATELARSHWSPN